MIKLNDIIEGKVEKIVYGGDGLIRYGEDKFVVFTEGVLPNEKVRVKITSLNKKFARAELVSVIDNNEHRVKPMCNLYNACGSCNCQIMDYDYSIELKTSILKDIFSDIIQEDKIFSVIKSDKTLEYRHKIQFPTRQTKNSKRILMGYFEKNSHKLTNIKFCPLQPKIVNDIAQEIRDNFELDCYDEKTNKGLLKNVLMRISSIDCSILLTLVLNCTQDEFSELYDSKIFKFFRKITSKFENIKGGFVNFNPKNNNKILTDDEINVYGENSIIEKLADKKYKIGSSSFFQVNPYASEKLFDIVKNNIDKNSTVLDAYGGVGAIGIYCVSKAKTITLVEENHNAIQMAKENFELNHIKNYEIFEGDAKLHFHNFEKEKRNFDYVILDPPRSGSDSNSINSISKIAKNIIYVSCNPQTLKRDMKQLLEFGFIPQFVQGVDLFPYTHHIESVVLFKKIKP